MVCKNCGADLKPGVKYCLNCGNYIDDEDAPEEQEEDSINLDDLGNDYSDENDSKLSFDDSDMEEEEPAQPVKKRRRKMSTQDMLIYGVLILIIVVSFIVMIVSLASGKKGNANPQPTNTVVEDIEVKMTNYTIKFSGELNYTQDGEIIYISDDKNYTFSYRNSLDDYERYSKDLTILENSLKKSGYSVLNSEKRQIDDTEFIVYKFKFDSTVKYLYVTKVNSKYITMGTIEEVENGDWREALTLINTINKNIKFKDGDDSKTDINNVLDSNASDISGIIK